MSDYLDFGDDREGAVRQAIALGLSSAFVAPPPFCSHPEWRGESPGPGRHAPHSCRSMTDVDAACPYLTTAATIVTVTRQGDYLVEVTPQMRRARGERVRVDGEDVEIGAGAQREREMRRDEREDEREDDGATVRAARRQRRQEERELLEDVRRRRVRKRGGRR